MAPKNKFTRGEMVAAAVQVVRAKGLTALTAKELAAQLGVSTQPVFTCFGTMDAAKQAVWTAAQELYAHYIQTGLAMDIPFYGVGIQHIRFAQAEPNLYRLLFLTPVSQGANDAMAAMTQAQALVRPSLTRCYHITEREADRYFRDMWLVVHSLATLIVTGGCPYSHEEIGTILTGVSVSLCKAIKEIPGFVAGTYDRDQVFRSLIEGGKHEDSVRT